MAWLLLVGILSASASEVHLTEVHVLGTNEQNSLVDFLPSTTTLSGTELQKRRETTLGDTLKSEAGVNSNSFGSGASRPVIRGMDGDRIRILQNGLGTLDASAQSADHAVPIDTLNIERLEVVRGPMSLLYGASAVGGVVNVVNQRIHTQFEEGHLWQAESQTESAYGGHASGVRADHGVSRWMLHADAGLRDYGDQRVSKQSHTPKNRVGNSQSLQRTAGIGVSRIFDRGHLGFSFGHFASDYGSVQEPTVEIFMKQNRWEISGEHRWSGTWIDKVRIRSAVSKYRHDERDSGSVGTVFENDGSETRVEFLRNRGPWSSVYGAQAVLFKFSAQGDEAYLPTSNNQQAAVFNFNEYKYASEVFSFGLRAEPTETRRKESANFGAAEDRGFTGLSGSTGWVHQLKGAWSTSLNYSYTERAPTFQELFSNGAHVATGTFDVGDTSLKKEEVHGLEFAVRHKSAEWEMRTSVYAQDFNRYIALSPTGATDSDGNAIFNYEQVDARFYGTDMESRWHWQPRWALVGKGDIVRAKNLDNGSNLPRISPGRVSLGVEHEQEKWRADAETQYVFMQSKTAPNETSTRGFTLVNIGAARTFSWDEQRLEFFLRLKNILDEQARQHLSFVKEAAPMPGRNLVVGVQGIF